ncbi:FG-GAP repeat domain-containing protein [Maribacter sp. 2304DJ31-5]|uniref:FG-GAP repeat domain-containing protein n=1 Tax=Maribacter sp. 2304DJ31-5 TaxID=3386273 RepID=UPI0039BC9ECC
MKKILCTILGLTTALSGFAQNPEEDKIRATNMPKFKALKIANIPGAVQLSQPQWITGSEQDVRVEKHGLIYPAMFDWDKDGKEDLLLGEFETSDTLSNIKVYLNKGTKALPKYTGKYFYAKDVNGNRIANSQWCCIGIHPRFVDITGDGYLDILSGQYNPGIVSLWRGSKDGFLPREIVEQEGWQEDEEQHPLVIEKRHGTKRGSAPWEPDHLMYWNYTTTDFADFNGDGLLDLFVGSSSGIRVALNTGTKDTPKFGIRKDLYHVNGDILYVKKPSKKEIEADRSNGIYPNLAGASKAYIKPIDWDNDGVLDLLITTAYYKNYHHGVYFYKGIQTDKGLRFNKYVPLFEAKDDSKSLPGTQPMLTVTDYNNDGFNDLVIGTSIPTTNGFEVDDKMTWNWIEDTGIEMPGKDAGRQIEYSGGLEVVKKEIEEDPSKTAMYLGQQKDLKYLTLRHRGYVFVMYGSKPKTKAKKAKTEIAGEGFIPERISVDNKVTNTFDHVSFEILTPKRIGYHTVHEAVVNITFEDGWHGYVDNEANKKDSFIPTMANINLPYWLEPVGELQMPKKSKKAGAEVYKNTISFVQKFKMRLLEPENVKEPEELDWDKATKEETDEYDRKYAIYEEAVMKLPQPTKEFKIEYKVVWQTCDDNMCLPPKTVEESATVKNAYF